MRSPKSRLLILPQPQIIDMHPHGFSLHYIHSCHSLPRKSWRYGQHSDLCRQVTRVLSVTTGL